MPLRCAGRTATTLHRMPINACPTALHTLHRLDAYRSVGNAKAMLRRCDACTHWRRLLLDAAGCHPESNDRLDREPLFSAGCSSRRLVGDNLLLPACTAGTENDSHVCILCTDGRRSGMTVATENSCHPDTITAARVTFMHESSNCTVERRQWRRDTKVRHPITRNNQAPMLAVPARSEGGWLLSCCAPR
jgi:hypothetical protein